MNLVDTIKTIQRACGAEPDGVFGPATAQCVLRALELDGPNGNIDSDDLDERTIANILTLDPKARDRFIQLARLCKATAATLGCDYVMISGHRTWEEQDELFARRPIVTRAAGGYSNHNFGIAGDFGVFRGKSYLDDSNPALARQVHLASAVHARQLGFECGADWKRFPDLPHYELSTGLTMTEKRALYKKKGSIL